MGYKAVLSWPKMSKSGQLMVCGNYLQDKVDRVIPKPAVANSDQKIPEPPSFDKEANSSLSLSLVVRNPVFGVSDQVRHEPGCAVIEDG